MPRVLHVCPLWQPVSPDAHGGVETLVADLVQAQVRLGWECAVVASADSRAGVPVIPAAPRGVGALYAAGEASAYAPFEHAALDAARAAAPGFDVVHCHLGPPAYALSRASGLGARVVHTLHGPADADLVRRAATSPQLRLATPFRRDAARLGARWLPHGVALERLAPAGAPGAHLAFVGRLEAAKGPDLAIAAARATGRPLVLAGPVNDPAFYAERIAPLLDGEIQHAGVVTGAAKVRLLAGAACAVVPSRAEEAFGLVAAEAMACGTPVAALARGALAEVVEPGVTGALATDAADLPAAVRTALTLDRARVRARAVERFDIRRTAEAHDRWYREIGSSGEPPDARLGSLATP
jgi:glycosyltransferase involved in cell wall biosynthesis